jgi:hypothetical protein
MLGTMLQVYSHRLTDTTMLPPVTTVGEIDPAVEGDRNRQAWSTGGRVADRTEFSTAKGPVLKSIEPV